MITILAKNVKKEGFKFNVDARKVQAQMVLQDGSDYALNLDLAHPVNADQSSYRVFGSKVCAPSFLKDALPL